MNKFLLIICFFFCYHYSSALTNLPVKEWRSDKHDKPLIFYISGDGGFNEFSTKLCKTLNVLGYDVTALNARTYFWDKKSPSKTSEDILDYLSGRLKERINQEVILIGYSFGADVMPFIANGIGSSIKLKTIFLLAPSTTTDFEVHLSDILGGNSKGAFKVMPEINKMQDKKLVIIIGSDDKSFPVKTISLKQYRYETLPGGHHFEGNIEGITSLIMKHGN